jgi:hypothetical protein
LFELRASLVQSRCFALIIFGDGVSQLFAKAGLEPLSS